jgi:hypothetical protein
MFLTPLFFRGMKNKIIKIVVFLSFALLLTSFINTYLSIKLWDYDFWWHLATGKYIIENKSIPDEDPFSFVSNLEENKNLFPEREKFSLKQYWLSQILFYKIYNTFSDKGIIILRLLILFSIVLITLWWFNRNKISFYIAYPFIFLIFLQTMAFTGERPVLFTMLFAVGTFFMLDDFKQRKSKLIYFLIPLMLLWANLHGGFILGILFILVFIAGETTNFILKKDKRDRKALLTLCIVGFIAIAASGVNPNGLSVLFIFSEKARIFESGTQEYFSPFILYSSKIRPIDVDYIILLVLFPLLAVLRNKKIDIVYYFLLCGLLYMSVSALRYLIYFISIGSMILGRELYYLIEDYFTKVNVNRFKFNVVASSCIFISTALYAGGVLDIDKISFAKAEKFSVPKRAADFLMTNNIKGNMFNDMGFGGYLIWRLYPQKQVFIDTRQLNYTLVKEYEWITYSRESIMNTDLPKGKKPLWERLLDHYKIDLVVLDTVDVMGSTKPVLFTLLRSDHWVPVYCDIISVIFLRENKTNEDIIKEYRIDKEFVYNSVIARLTQLAMLNRKNPQYLFSLGEVFSNMGRYQDALTAFTYADKRLPDQEGIKLLIDLTKERLQKEKESEVKKEEK